MDVMPDEPDHEGTAVQTKAHASNSPESRDAVRGFRLHVVEGPEKGRVWTSESAQCSIGSLASNDVVIKDDTVSRFHCEIVADASGARVRDLDSLNGTLVDGVKVVEAHLRDDSALRLGATVVRFRYRSESNELRASEATSFGGMIGSSPAMRRAFALLERAAASNATVLLEGETGTGKGRAAQAIHDESARKGMPFETLDCGSIPATLIESELFGHERGAFTGATAARAGVIEQASGGTLFLDEIGEMPIDLQPKLLRVLENREIRRVGASQRRPVDVRIIAATNRDLRAEVNAGRFRPDLYFRIAVLKIAIPPLRERREDLPALVEGMLSALGATPAEAAPLRTPEFQAQIARARWPGNVRELRNCVERCLVFEDARSVTEDEPASSRRPAAADGARLPLTEARQNAVDAFEKRYLEELIAAHGGKMSRAAEAAGINRVYLYKLLRRHGLK
jgi:DNA-binding NtrC family response regulator